VVPDRNYSGIPGSSLRSWGDNIVTDDAGNASGIILIPSGRKPSLGTFHEENIEDLTFDESVGLKFPLGVKKIKFTSSSTNGHHPQSFANVSFFATAIKETAP
jgi:hypothetical protein